MTTTPDARTTALRAQAAGQLAALTHQMGVSMNNLYTAVRYGVDSVVPVGQPEEMAMVMVMGAVHAVAARVGETAEVLGMETYRALTALDRAERKAVMLGCDCAAQIALVEDTCEYH
jgi:hypothetical protein